MEMKVGSRVDGAGKINWDLMDPFSDDDEDHIPAAVCQTWTFNSNSASTSMSSSDNDPEAQGETSDQVQSKEALEIVEETDEQIRDQDEEAAEKALEQWDPAGMAFYGPQNILMLDFDEDPGGFLRQEKYKPLTLSEVPCPHFNEHLEEAYCYKGPRCKLKHQNTTLEKTVYSVTNLFDKGLLCANMWLCVSMRTVISPSEFYLMPVEKSLCLCQQGQKQAEPGWFFDKNSNRYQLEALQEEYGEGAAAYDAITLNLNDVLETGYRWMNHQALDYVVFQLVAVRLKNDDGDVTWYRAFILGGGIRQTSQQIPSYQIQLIDTGETLLAVSAKDLCVLPPKFCTYPSLALKCSLNNTRPLSLGPLSLKSADWSEEAINTFFSIVSACNSPPRLLAYIHKSNKDDNLGDASKTVDPIPYQVDLYILRRDTPQGIRTKFRMNEVDNPFISVNHILRTIGVAASYSVKPKNQDEEMPSPLSVADLKWMCPKKDDEWSKLIERVQNNLGGRKPKKTDKPKPRARLGSI